MISSANPWLDWPPIPNLQFAHFADGNRPDKIMQPITRQILDSAGLHSTNILLKIRNMFSRFEDEKWKKNISKL